MSATRKHSFGIVPIAFAQDGAPLFLILRAYRNWDFPKGQPDAEEAPLATAAREMAEETGIRELALAWGEVCMDTEIQASGKIVTYYPARVTQQAITLPVSAELGRPEHHEYRWASYAEARSLLPARLVRVLDWARALAAAKNPDR